MVPTVHKNSEIFLSVYIFLKLSIVTENNYLVKSDKKLPLKKRMKSKYTFSENDGII